MSSSYDAPLVRWFNKHLAQYIDTRHLDDPRINDGVAEPDFEVDPEEAPF